MRYRYLDDFPPGISVFAIFSYGITVLGTPPPKCPPPEVCIRSCIIFFELIISPANLWHGNSEHQ